MKPVATALSHTTGVLEPLQTTDSIEGQLQELYTVLKDHARIPVTVIGHSWGAWLSFLFTARYPAIVGRLILVASGPFEEQYASDIMEKRMNRLGENEQSEIFTIVRQLNDPSVKEKNTLFTRLGKLLSKADSFDALPGADAETKIDADIFQHVWKEAVQLRRSGKLLELGKNIGCPVRAIHGDYDPHPAEGVEKPLSTILRDFRFFLLNNCGHQPWIEKQARDEFYRILLEEVKETGIK